MICQSVHECMMLSQVLLDLLGLAVHRVPWDSLENPEDPELLDPVDRMVRRAHRDNLETVDLVVRLEQPDSLELRDLVVRRATLELVERMDSLDQVEILDRLETSDPRDSQVKCHSPYNNDAYGDSDFCLIQFCDMVAVVSS